MHLKVTCHDPIIARDGRPFGAGGKMRPVGWPLPSVVAGSFRTLLGKLKDPTFGGDLSEQLKQVKVHGFLPAGPDGLYFPRPEDCLGKPRPNGQPPELLATRPMAFRPGQGCDLPEGNLLPVMLDPSAVSEEFKPAELPEWWPAAAMARWLTGAPVVLDETYLRKPALDERVHLEIQELTGAAEEGKIFSTASLALAALPAYGNEKKYLRHPRMIWPGFSHRELPGTRWEGKGAQSHGPITPAIPSGNAPRQSQTPWGQVPAAFAWCLLPPPFFPMVGNPDGYPRWMAIGKGLLQELTG